MLISVLGDSISTWPGTIPPNFSLYYDEPTAWENGLGSVEDTWWHKVLSRLSGDLCANNSFSGSLVSGNSFPSACSAKRIGYLSDGERYPDTVLVYLGINDFLFGAPDRDVRFVDIDCEIEFCFFDAYSIMLRSIRRSFPTATVVCATLMKTSLLGRGTWAMPRFNPQERTLEQYNDSIRAAVSQSSSDAVRLVDVAALGRTYQTLDGVHPTKEGHAQLAQAWLDALQQST